MLAWHATHVGGQYEAYAGGYRYLISPCYRRLWSGDSWGPDLVTEYKLYITGPPAIAGLRGYYTVQCYRTIGTAKGQATRIAKRLQRLYGERSGDRVPSLTSENI
jgi:hypothetical protein